MSEEMVVRQAAPTLAGIKTGSLFPCPCTEKETLLEEIRAFNRRYLSRGLCLLPLRFTEGKALLYLYRPAALRRDLRGRAIFRAPRRNRARSQICAVRVNQRDEVDHRLVVE